VAGNTLQRKFLNYSSDRSSAKPSLVGRFRTFVYFQRRDYRGEPAKKCADKLVFAGIPYFK
ncbi:MAG: hypothetical protein ACRCWQ_08630, partial [Bacilli bacterium]